MTHGRIKKRGTFISSQVKERKSSKEPFSNYYPAIILIIQPDFYNFPLSLFTLKTITHHTLLYRLFHNMLASTQIFPLKTEIIFFCIGFVFLFLGFCFCFPDWSKEVVFGFTKKGIFSSINYTNKWNDCLWWQLMGVRDNNPSNKSIAHHVTLLCHQTHNTACSVAISFASELKKQNSSRCVNNWAYRTLPGANYDLNNQQQRHSNVSVISMSVNNMHHFTLLISRGAPLGDLIRIPGTQTDTPSLPLLPFPLISSHLQTKQNNERLDGKRNAGEVKGHVVFVEMWNSHLEKSCSFWHKSGHKFPPQINCHVYFVFWQLRLPLCSQCNIIRVAVAFFILDAGWLRWGRFPGKEVVVWTDDNV